ncbi:hypothetical protein Pst134EA_024429 [Puccinia striiformis f. sp. tritici]|uniref:hypothetical protein n=1 Tax=Puccinia striiformis f. sp. tritici TaxID=168172 RepID=UPI00200868CD|nr:hypothetical protein Pst134EA_024429 [Puccinia striiformis f. sp. tritici]KAH9444865.1 hypothetical protein Pst134EB_025121 [Puccinia striiformis f. sp. tritici]KAH9453560.1 hypothetical protein Pst134EA_024429 [Puccinia striiformis f. sp. tritici]KAI9606899.1 hypothetical protein H4Q26_006443 [Puccinia striiformis f. sp. tritici PST-130]KAI9614078.1 hypothetical protein KEM48_006145 [Puccinia striiformis f. sp. tritici PST-130]
MKYTFPPTYINPKAQSSTFHNFFNPQLGTWKACFQFMTWTLLQGGNMSIKDPFYHLIDCVFRDLEK